jgi:hypothetical protein
LKIKKQLGLRQRDAQLKKGKESKISKDRKKKKRDRSSSKKQKISNIELMSYILKNKNLKSKECKCTKPSVKWTMRSAKCKPQWTTHLALGTKWIKDVVSLDSGINTKIRETDIEKNLMTENNLR